MSTWQGSTRPLTGEAFSGLAPQRRCVLEAWFLLGLARVAIRLVPFRDLARWMGGVKGEAAPIPCANPDGARQVALAIARASRTPPWTSNCLVQAIAGHCMLRRRGIASTLTLGVIKQGPALEAHAWLRAGDLIVTGESGAFNYTPIASFGAPL